jgi:hypothetical protein
MLIFEQGKWKKLIRSEKNRFRPVVGMCQSGLILGYELKKGG